MPFKVQVTDAEGNVVTGTLADEDVPEGLVTQETADEQFAQKFAPRANRLKRNYRTELLADPEFVKEALAAQDVDLDALKAAAAAGGEVDADKLAAMRQGWEAESLAPVTQKLDALNTQLDTLRAGNLKAAIVEAARRVGVKEEFLRAPTKGADPMIVAAFSGKFAFDEDSQRWLERDGDDFQFSANPEKYGSPHRGVEEAFDLFAKDKDAAALYLTDKRQTGPGFDGTPHRAGSADVTLTESQALNAQVFEEAETRATKQGGHVVTVPDE